MANRYWVGGTGNWSDTGHWSLTSGGAGGQAAPTSVDDVFIDDNSGDSGFVLTIPSALGTIQFKDFIDTRFIAWELVGESTIDTIPAWSVYGSITLSSNATVSEMGRLYARAVGGTYDTKGLSVYEFLDYPNAIISFTSDFISRNSITTDSSGSGVTLVNASKLKAKFINKSTLTDQSYTLNEGTLELNYIDDTDISTLILNAGTSILRLLDSSKVFESGSLAWHNVELQGDNITINGSPTMNKLTGITAQTINIQAGQTITLSDLAIDGCSLIGL